MNSVEDKSDQVTDAPVASEASAAPRQAGAPWGPDDVKLLGTMPDSEVARLLNRAHIAVRRRRHKLRIQAFQSPFRRWMTPLSG